MIGAAISTPETLEIWAVVVFTPESPAGAVSQFLQDLQTFIEIAYGHFHNGHQCSVTAAMSRDTHQLIRALGKSIVFDRCPKCTDGEKTSAVLDYEACPD
jgi:hypothetical protein